MNFRFGPFGKTAEPMAAASGQEFRASTRRGAGDTMRGRLMLASACFVLVYGAIIGRLVQMGVSLPQESVTLGNAQAAVSAGGTVRPAFSSPMMRAARLTAGTASRSGRAAQR